MMTLLLAILALTITGCDRTDGPVQPSDSTPPAESDPPTDSQAPGDSETDSDSDTEPSLLVVNELMADNGGSTLCENAIAHDWLELYNGSDEAMDLGGYSLSDDPAEPDKAVLPEGTLIDAQGHLLLWADGSGENDGHVALRLSRDGESVGIFDPDARRLDWVSFPSLTEDSAWARLPDGSDSWDAVEHGTPGSSNMRVEEQTTELVAKGATWHYLDTGEPPDGSWTQADFDDSAWASGPAPLGYGDSQTTQVSYGDDSGNKHPTTWFRHAFDADTSLVGLEGELVLSLRVDDGAVVHLNGSELLRQGMPDGEITADTYASFTASDASETGYTDYALEAAVLQAEANQLAVEVHQANATSSDITLDLGLSLVAWVQVE